MSGNVHQSDKDKLKATVTQAEDVTVVQSDASKLKGTVTQAAKDRTVTGSVTAVQTVGANLKVEVSQDPFGSLTVEQAAAASLKCEPTQTTAANLKATTYEAQQLVPFEHDYIALSYTGDNLTGVVYKTGGSGGSTVATLTLAYTDSRLDSVTRT